MKYALKISCTVENIDEISTPNPGFEWQLKLKCKDCNEIDSSWHTICENEEVEGKSGPGIFNFQMKCKFCSSVGTVDIVKGSTKALKVNDNDRVDKQVVVIFDCRSVEPVGFDPQGKWIAKCTETGNKFDDVEFLPEEDSWAGYDEKGNRPVSVDGFKGFFERV